jgi:hypothetical protein
MSPTARVPEGSVLRQTREDRRREARAAMRRRVREGSLVIREATAEERAEWEAIPRRVLPSTGGSRALGRWLRDGHAPEARVED